MVSALDLVPLIRALAAAGVRQPVIVLRGGRLLLCGEAEFVAASCLGWGEDQLAKEILARAGHVRCGAASVAVVVELYERRARVRGESIAPISGQRPS